MDKIDLKLSQAELGNYVGLSRANVSRQLGVLKSRGAIDALAGHIVINNESLLESAAGIEPD